jgi:hypothetical protein
MNNPTAPNKKHETGIIIKNIQAYIQISFPIKFLNQRLHEDANRIAEEANSIARRALFNSKTANIWAAIATPIAAIAMYTAYIKTP